MRNANLLTSGHTYSTIIPAEPERHGFDGFLIVATDGTFCAARHKEWGRGESVASAVSNMRPIKDLGFNVSEYQMAYFKLISLKMSGLLFGRDIGDMVDEVVLGVAPRKLERQRMEWAECLIGGFGRTSPCLRNTDFA